MLYDEKNENCTYKCSRSFLGHIDPHTILDYNPWEKWGNVKGVTTPEEDTVEKLKGNKNARDEIIKFKNKWLSYGFKTIEELMEKDKEWGK